MAQFLANVGRALMFNGSNELIGVGRTYTENTFDFAITAEEIRGGEGKDSPLY